MFDEKNKKGDLIYVTFQRQSLEINISKIDRDREIIFVKNQNKKELKVNYVNHGRRQCIFEKVSKL